MALVWEKSNTSLFLNHTWHIYASSINNQRYLNWIQIDVEHFPLSVVKSVQGLEKGKKNLWNLGFTFSRGWASVLTKVLRAFLSDDWAQDCLHWLLHKYWSSALKLDNVALCITSWHVFQRQMQFIALICNIKILSTVRDAPWDRFLASNLASYHQLCLSLAPQLRHRTRRVFRQDFLSGIHTYRVWFQECWIKEHTSRELVK